MGKDSPALHDSRIKADLTPTKRALIVVNQATMTIVATTNIQEKEETPFERETKTRSPSLNASPDRRMPGKDQALPVYAMLEDLSHRT